MNSILLLTKDALCKDYLPIYGNKYWKGETPNIDELAKKGTVFNRHYTAAPSTVMAFRAMVTGKFAYEQPYSNYTPQEVDPVSGNIFEMASAHGYESHMIWDSTWQNMVLRYGNIYGKGTTIHNMSAIKQGVGCHYRHNGTLKVDNNKVRDTIERIVDEVEGILSGGKNVFVWIHLPHVINGRTSYGGDIDAFDTIIGEMRKLFGDDNIFISADHGNMNGYKGKYCYGFDVNTPAVEIPLITPKIECIDFFDKITSNVDIKDLIFERRITKREYVFSDSAYFAQPQRKLAIMTENYAYIYNKSNDTEEFYDLKNDKYERVNLLKSTDYDEDRRLFSPIREYYFSPYWDEIEKIITPFREIKKEIWRNGSIVEELKEKWLSILKKKAIGLKMKFK